MGIYAKHIFPRLMDGGLGSAAQRTYRERALSEARGLVLEIGFGTGLNLACYPEGVERVVGVDPVRMLERRVEGRIARAPFPVDRLVQDAADPLPFRDATFDTVVSTWTLCSIGRLPSALAELRRVLKPGGRFLFLEHGRSDHRVVAAIQDAANPVQNAIGCGCNLNRRIDEEIERGGFRILRLERFRMPGVPRVLGEVYEGAAVAA